MTTQQQAEAYASLEKMRRYDYGPEEDFVLHLPPSIADERDPAEEPDETGALGQMELCDDRAFYGVSTAWKYRHDMADGNQQLIARRRLRRKAWDSLIIPWEATDLQLKERIPIFVKQLKEIDPTIDRDDVTQAIFKTIMCREQIKHVKENGIKIGYDNSLRETVFHPKNQSMPELVSFSGPTRREDLKAYLKEKAAAERLRESSS